MSKRPVLTAITIGLLMAGAASAQLRGGPVGGVVGGGVGGVRETIGGTVGGVGRTTGGVVSGVGSSVGGLGGPAGSVGGAVGGLGGGLAGVGSSVERSLSGPLGSVAGAGGGLGRLGAGGSFGSSGTSGNFARVSDGWGSLTESELISSVHPEMVLEEVYQPWLSESEPALLARIRKLRHEMLIKAYPRLLDRDPAGQPVRRNELIAVDPDTASLHAAVRAGFRIVQDERPLQLGLRVLTLACPKGVNVRDGVKLLRKAAPALQVDYNHVYEPAGGALLPAAGAKLAARTTVRPGTRIAMIDGGVAAHPSLARASVEQRGFAGPAEPTGHGTAVGSLLVGTQGPFNGAARGAQLFVGDVYGGNPSAGSASVIIRALAWAASKRPAVVNISLVGPENSTLSRAIAGLRARGIAVVAAVGNDGPAAPPQYPASYPGVIAVTGVDGQDRALREAGRAAHLDFAAPGADLVAALPGNGYTPVRGTSFAAPFVAARLAATGSPVVLAAEAVPGKGKVGRGIVCKNCRILPKMVGIR